MNVSSIKLDNNSVKVAGLQEAQALTVYIN